MSLTEHKKIVLIGGVIAGSAIILTARLLIGDGFKRTETSSGLPFKETYERFRTTTTDTDDLAALKAKVEAQATIKTLGEKLKTTSKTDTTNK